MIPLYYILFKVLHEDKIITEDHLIAIQEGYTISCVSLLINGESKKMIHVSVEDPKAGTDSKAIGYTISRKDVGK